MGRLLHHQRPGELSDYEVVSAHATEFTFSRFAAAKGSPAEGTKGVIEASSIDRVADPATEPQRRRLSEAPCPPPSAGGSTGEPAVSAPPPEPPLPPPPFYYSPAPPDVYNPSLPAGGRSTTTTVAEIWVLLGYVRMQTTMEKLLLPARHQRLSRQSGPNTDRGRLRRLGR